MLQSAISLVRGDDYYIDDDRQLIFSLPFTDDTPNLADAEVSFKFYPQANVSPTLTVSGVVQNAGTSSQQAVFQLSAANTALLTSVSYIGVIIATITEAGTAGDHTVTLMRVLVTVNSPAG